MSNIKFGLQLQLDGDQVVIRGLQNVRGEVKGFGTDLGGTTREVENASRANAAHAQTYGLIKTAIGALGLGIGLRELKNYSSEWTDLNARVARAVGPMGDAADMMDRLQDIARSSYASLENTAEAYLLNANALKEWGFRTQEQLDFTESLNLALVVSGAKQQRAESVINAMSKAIAEGTLRGQNFTTVMQQGGAVVESLAIGLGVTTLELQAMAAAGELTADKVVRALNSELETLRKQADDMPLTINDALQQLDNGLMAVTGRLMETTGAASNAAEAIDKVAGFLKDLDAEQLDIAADAVLALAMTTGGVLALNLAKATLAWGGKTVATIRDTAVTRAAAVEALRLAQAEHAKTVATVASMQAQVGATVSTTTYTAAQARATAAATALAAAQTAVATTATVATRALAVLGGPIGIVAALAASFLFLRTRTEENTHALADLTIGTDAYAEALENLTVKQARSAQFGLEDQIKRDEQALAKQLELLEKVSRYGNPEQMMGERPFADLEADIEKKEKELADTRQRLADVTRIAKGEELELAETRNANAAAIETLNTALADELDWLQREIVAFTQGEAALEAFNREKFIANRLAKEKIEELSPDELAALEAEIGAVYDAQRALKGKQEAQAENTRRTEQDRREQKAYTETLQSLADTLFPVEAEIRKVTEQLGNLREMEERGIITADQHRQARARLTEQLHALNNPLEKTIQGIQQETALLQAELVATMQGETALRAFNREKAIEAELRRENVVQGSAEEEQLRREIAARYDAAQALVDYRDSVEEAKRAQEEANRVSEQFITEIVGQFASGVDSIGDYFKSLWERIKREFINSGVAQLLGFTSGTPTPLISGLGQMFGGGGAGGGTALLSVLGKIPGVGGALGSVEGLTHAVLTLGPAIGGLTGAITGWRNQGALGAITGAAGGAFGASGGAALGTMIMPGIGTLVGSILGGMLGGNLGAAVFGGRWEDRRSGIELGFGDEGFLAQQYVRQTKKGGLFGSTKRRYIYDDLDAEQAALFDQSYTATLAGVQVMYEALGIAVGDATLEGVRIGELRLDSSLSEADIEKRVAQWFGELADTLVRAVDGSLDAATLETLATAITGVNSIFAAMRLETYEVSRAGAELAARLVEMAGGIEAFQASSDFYYQHFYSEQERAQYMLEQFNNMIAAFNDEFGTAIQSKDDLRAFVDQLSASGAMATEAGMEMYLAAMNLAPALVGAADAMEVLAQSAAGLSAGRLNTLNDIAATALQGYTNTLNDRARIEEELAKVNADIEASLARIAGGGQDLATGMEPLPGILDAVTGAVDSLAFSSSQLRSWAASLLGLVSQLTLSDISPLTHGERFRYAQAEFARAQAQAEAGDPSQLAATAQAFLRENAAYYGSSDTGNAIFHEVVNYLQSMGITLDQEADRAEVHERAQREAEEAHRQALEVIRQTQQAAADQAREDARIAQEQARLDELLQQQQILEQALIANNTADALTVLESQLAALVHTTQGIDSVAHLLSVLPQELAAALGGIIGMQPAQYGGTTDLVERMYQEILGRSGAPGGVAYWQTVQAQGANPQDLVAWFIDAARQNGETPQMTAQQFLASLTSFDTGTSFVPHDQLAQIHAREIIVDPESSDILRRYGIRVSGDSPQVVTLLSRIDEHLASLRVERSRDEETAQQARGRQERVLDELRDKIAREIVEL